MKKIIAIALAAVLLFAAAILYYNYSKNSAATVTDTTTTEQSDADTTATSTSGSVDYDAIYKLHDADEVIMTVGGRDVTWGEYFYWYYTYGQQIEQMMMYAPMYGMEVNWDDVCDETTGETYAQMPAVGAEAQSKLYAGMFVYADENNIDFDDECEKEYQDSITSNVSAAGMDSEDEFFAALKDMYITKSIYDTQVKASILNEKAFSEKYGTEGENLSDEDAVKYLEDNNYMHVMHILFANTDKETSEALTDEQLAEKKAQAEKLVEELNAITDNEKRAEKFVELAKEYNEDSNYEYTFTEGEMVSEFETEAKELNDYEVALVETSYGYHVMMKLPLDPDATLTDGNTVKYTAAMALFNDILDEYIESLKVEYKNNFVAPNITEYIVETSTEETTNAAE